jgi:acylglycerol lipase
VKAVIAAVLLFLAACAPVVIPAGPAVAPAQIASTGDAITATDGTKLALRSWLPQGEPKAVLIAVHGFNDYSYFFDMAGKWFAGQGVASYAYDQRGFGQSGQRGFWPGIDTLTQDLATAIRLIGARHPGKPVFVVGESMGGAVTLVTMTNPGAPPVAGFVLSAPAVWGRKTMPFYQSWALAIASRTVPWMTLTGRGLDILASDNIEMLRALGRDPLFIKETRVDAIYGLVNLMDLALERAAALDHRRTLILYGMHDEVIPPNATHVFVERLPDLGGRQTVAVYEDGWHMLFRDLKAEIVWRDLLAWMSNAPLPSGADSHPLPPADRKPKRPPLNIPPATPVPPAVTEKPATP